MANKYSELSESGVQEVSKFVEQGDTNGLVYFFNSLLNTLRIKRERYIRTYREKLREKKSQIGLLIEILEEYEGDQGLYSMADKRIIRKIKFKNK